MQRLKLAALLLMPMGVWSHMSGHTLPVWLWFSIKTQPGAAQKEQENPVGVSESCQQAMNNGPHLRG